MTTTDTETAKRERRILARRLDLANSLCGLIDWARLVAQNLPEMTPAEADALALDLVEFSPWESVVLNLRTLAECSTTHGVIEATDTASPSPHCALCFDFIGADGVGDGDRLCADCATEGDDLGSPFGAALDR